MEESTAVLKRKGLSINTLKIIAMVCMVIDHIGAGIIEMEMLGGPEFTQLDAILSTPAGFRWYLADMLLRFIGRLAFPVFCFCLVEGFFHTGNLRKYAVRLLEFALLSEIPFDLAFYGTWFYAGAQNIFFTLFAGLAVMAGIGRFAGRKGAQVLIVLAGCAAAEFLRADYGAAGVLMVAVLYLFRSDRREQTLYGALMAAAESLNALGTAALAFLFIKRYNGERGKKLPKYLFYGFYPAHLIILWLARLLLFP